MSTTKAVKNSIKLLRDGGADAVKLEGGSKARVNAVKSITEAGIAVFGHVGLTPQSISSLGGFRPHGKTANTYFKMKLRHTPNDCNF